MFISHWFELSGIDKIMAPIDPDSPPPIADAAADGGGPSGNNNASNGYNDNSNNEIRDDGLGFWEIVAPRHRPDNKSDAASSSQPPSSTLTANQNQNQKGGQEVASECDRGGSTSTAVTDNGRLVQCQHCRKMTPVDGPSSSSSTTTTGGGNGTIQQQQQMGQPATPASESLHTPAAFHNNNNDNNNNNSTLSNHNDNDNNEQESSMFHTDVIAEERAYLHSQVLRAAHETSLAHSNPSFAWENAHKLFTLCGALPKPVKKNKSNSSKNENGKPVPSKNVKRITKILNDKPDLLYARSAGMSGTLNLRDGFTVLHAACHAGNEEVVDYLLRNHVALLGDVDDDDNDDDNKKTNENKKDSSNNKPMLDLNERDVQGRTALHVAADQGHIGVIRRLKTAYDALDKKMEQVQLQLLQDSSDDSDDDEVEEELLSETMAKLSTSESQKTKTEHLGHFSATPARRRPRRLNKSQSRSRSPKPPPSHRSPVRSPAFSGAHAPVDLSGRTPLGYAATSPVPKAKKHRGELEKVLYREGDRSILGEGRTPPKNRCGPRGPGVVGGVGVAGSGRKVAFDGHGPQGDNGGTNSYLSPTPRKHRGRYSNTPGSVTSSNFATPFESPPPTIPEEETTAASTTTNIVAKKENPLQLQWGASEMNGWRIEMEDKILVKYELYDNGERLPPRPSTLNDSDADTSATAIPTMGLFGVFDGHGDGGFASDFIATNLERKLKAQHEWASAYHSCNSSSRPLEDALTKACYDLDEDLKKDATKPRDGGTTAIFAVVSDDYLFAANVGDSRCILVKKRRKAVAEESGAVSTTLNEPCWELSDLEVIPMSEDHKPDLPTERARIESAGLTVQTDRVPPDENDPDGEYINVHRVRKSDKELLGVARAFGDYDYKSNGELSASRQAVVCTPDIVVREREDEADMYLVLACDGVWDVMSNEDVAAFVARRAAELLGWAAADGDEKSEQQTNSNVQEELLARVGDELLAKCLEKGSRDNMSVLIVAMPGSGLINDSLASSLQQTRPKKEDVTPVVDGTVRTLAFE